MALINCPECDKQISSLASECPHCKHKMIISETKVCPECGNSTANSICEVCGYPVDSMPNKPKTKKSVKKKIVIISAIVAVLVIIGIFIGISATNKIAGQYKADFSKATELMLEGAADSEKACNLIQNVWSNSIYQKSDEVTDKYTKTNGNFNDDFNDSLSALFSDNEFNSDVNGIISNRNSVNAIMGKLLNPPEKYEDAYEELEELYESYLKFCDLAISAKGSLKSFGEDFAEASTDFSHDYQIIQQYVN